MTLWCGVLGACNSEDVYHVFHPVAETGWERDDTLRFLFNLPDTTASYAFSVELRHRLDFPYTDLPVDMTLATAHDSILWRDTLSIPVADVWGNWVGKGCLGQLGRQGVGRSSYGFFSCCLFVCRKKRHLATAPSAGLGR